MNPIFQTKSALDAHRRLSASACRAKA